MIPFHLYDCLCFFDFFSLCSIGLLKICFITSSMKIMPSMKAAGATTKVFLKAANGLMNRFLLKVYGVGIWLSCTLRRLFLPIHITTSGFYKLCCFRTRGFPDPLHVNQQEVSLRIAVAFVKIRLISNRFQRSAKKKCLYFKTN